MLRVVASVRGEPEERHVFLDLGSSRKLPASASIAVGKHGVSVAASAPVCDPRVPVDLVKSDVECERGARGDVVSDEWRLCCFLPSVTCRHRFRFSD